MPTLWPHMQAQGRIYRSTAARVSVSPPRRAVQTRQSRPVCR